MNVRSSKRAQGKIYLGERDGLADRVLGVVKNKKIRKVKPHQARETNILNACK